MALARALLQPTLLPVLAVVLNLMMISCFSGVVHADDDPKVPCFFIFGDSLSDSGNNNRLISLAKANYAPHGIDFPDHKMPTGRFCNGRTTVDIIADKLDLDGYIPPYDQALHPDIAVKGVNYASAAAGILPETGIVAGQRIPLDLQLERHRRTIARIHGVHGNKTKKYIQKCLYSVWVGSNDWILNYFLNPLNVRPSTVTTTDEFADRLIKRFTFQLDGLYKMGARKVVLFGLSPLGCLPTVNVLGRCTEFVNEPVRDFNKRLKKLADNFRDKYDDLKLSYIDVYGIYGGHDMSTLKEKGFDISTVPCCGASSMVCLPTSAYCTDRTRAIFWDNGHPTEAVNKIIADRAYHRDHDSDAVPQDISHLIGDDDDDDDDDRR